jgi:hypothetical protein
MKSTIIVAMITVIQSLALAQSSTQILRMAPKDRILLVRAALEHRSQTLQNIDISSSTVHTTVKLNGEEIVSKGQKLFQQEYRLMRVDNSYKVTCTETDLDVQRPSRSWESSYDEDNGVNRSFAKIASKLSFGVIDYKHAQATGLNLIAFYLDGQVNDERKSYVATVLGTKHELLIDTSKHDVNDISVGVLFPPGNGEDNSLKLHLRPSHGFSVVAYERENSFTENGVGKLRGFEYGKVVEESQVNGVWLPVRVNHLTANMSTGLSTEAAVTVTSVRLNALTEKDLQVTFPVGTEVDDRIQQKAFLVGQESISTVVYAGQDTYSSPRTLARLADETASARRPWYFWVNVTVVTVMGVILLYLWRRQKTT